MKYTAIALLVVMLSASSLALRSESEYRREFVNFMRENRKVYKHDEFQNRYAIFKANIDMIDEHNSKNLGWTLAVNQFADLSKEEFKKMFTGLATPNPQSNVVELSTVGLPTTVDWRKQGAVTPVKNQGQCGSCWSFSTTGSLEGLNFLKGSKSLLSFSEQQLVDCSGSYGNEGCNGGLMDQAFKYVEAYGIELESQYPYTAQDGSCHYDKSQTKFTNKGFQDVAQNSPQQLAAAVANQPVSIAIEADQSVFQFYNGGVITSSSCGTNLDHGVLIVGYGSEGGQDFWIVKNSWGASWGENGYVRIAKSNDSGPGICGINMMPSYPTA